ncbi:MAG: ABC transporter ATP-binding protein, partial [Lachnospiraceae bacterium]|nr:ABC transporter ATP-binding protein [Lachnospiraceae bacterium]
VVEFRNVSLKYHEDADDAVSNISFTVKRGETFGIIGGTGAGKTTVANLIPAFYKASEGEVLVCGNPVDSIETGVLRRFVGIVMQKSVLFEGTIRDNLKWGSPDASDEELLTAVNAAVCSEVVEEKGGLDGHVEAGGRNFSGGQRQRLSIARTLAARPELLILDDSSSALDYMTDKKLRENIKGLPFKPTVIIIAQRTISVRDCDNILVLDDGEQVGLGTHDELLKSCEVYREIYDSQYRKEDV